MQIEGLDPWVERFLAGRARGAGSDSELGRAVAELDSIWWREAETLLLRVAREGVERASFAPDERLFLDLGLLDDRLLPGGAQNRPALLQEISAPARSHLFYFSEWIAQRLRQFVVTEALAPAESGARASLPKLHELRARLYARLAPFFKALPGYTPQAIDHFLDGRIDGTLDAMAPSEDAGRRRQLLDLRNRMVERAREHARRDDELALFDTLGQVDRQLEAERAAVPARPASAPPRAPRPEEHEEFARGELKLVRSLLNLGGAGPGHMKATSVLVTAQRRTKKADLEPALALVRECDPKLPGEPSVLLAPYAGDGFYEWDRDTIFVPIVALRPAAETLVDALARYRILLDARQDGGRLRREYELAFGGGNFHADFVRDYASWVLGVGRGAREAVDPRRFTFFRDFLGPQPASLYAPAAWEALTPAERAASVRECRARAERGEAGFEDRFRLALAAAREDEFAQALRDLQAALRIVPASGRALLAAGHAASRLGGAETARRMFGDCLSRAPGTIWSVYASIELEKL